MIVSLLMGVFFIGAKNVQAQMAITSEIKQFDTHDFRQYHSFLAYPKVFKGGSSVAYGDIDGDGADEIITGAGFSGGPNVKIFKPDGTKLLSFMAYEGNFKRGINVASCDLDGNGRAEIVTGPKPGGGPNVKVFSGSGERKANFMAYADEFRGGVNVACGDVTGDGIGDIITGSGFNGESHVRLFNGHGDFLGLDFRPFSKSHLGGVSVATANVDGAGADEIIMGLNRFGHAWVKVYRATSDRPILTEFNSFPNSFVGGINVAGADVDRDGRDEIVVAANGMGGPDVKLFNANGQYLNHFLPYSESFRGGVNVASGDENNDGADEILIGPNRLIARSIKDIGHRIEVDLSEQRLYAYEDGNLVKTFLVSTGIAKYPTPIGDFKVFRRIPLMDYEWTYGPQHPDNYDIKDVPWNLNFTPHYYLHAAYWHNAFGARRSHGCVNISIPNAKWLYDWAPLGTAVMIRD